jgi:putative holliday junction resolvase
MANIVSLDVGTKRIGVAAADTIVPIALPIATVDVDGHEVERIIEIAKNKGAKTVVVGYPRNQSGEATAQTGYAEAFAARLGDSLQVVFQDESLTSVMAEDRLKADGKPYSKADIDAMAAAIILQDYLESHHAA